MYKNFLSTGDTGVFVQLDKSPTTLITAPNGSGKSTMSDAITFGLFGKSYRGLKKANMVNTLNKKNAVVEIVFENGVDLYKVVRGIKPNVFEIYKNNELVDEEAAVRDYQNYLETQVLGFNFKAFCQTAILGTANYIPFMQLPTGHRREVIETLFGINVFTTMNKLLKQKVGDWKTNVTDTRREIEDAQNQIEMRKEFLQTLNKADAEKIVAAKDRIGEIKSDISKLQTKATEIEAEALKNSSYDTIDTAILEIQQDQILITDHVSGCVKKSNEIHTKINMLQGNIDKLHDVEGKNCPLCKQDVSEKHVNHAASDIEAEIVELRKKLEVVNGDIAENNKKNNELQSKIDSFNEVRQKISDLKANIKQLGAVGKNIVADIQKMTEAETTITNIEEEKAKIAEKHGELNVLKRQYNKLLEKESPYRIAVDLLKDTGIKAKIIAQYLPILNQRVNHYLSLLNFNVKFELDENFDETLRSRNRTEFTYNNFSQGERQRIDLAMLFGWRDLASMMNSVNCNLLILDETFDSSLDSQGTDDLLSIIDTIGEKTNVFVVSHKGNLEDKFRSTIRFEKVNGFTKLA